MSVHSSPRWLVARTAGLCVMLGVYVSVFGTGVSDDSPPNTPDEAGVESLDDVTEALQKQLDCPDLAANDRWTGVVTRRITRPLVIDLDKVGPASLRGLGLSRLIMDGPGPAIRIVGTHDGTADPDSVKPNVWERQRMPLIDGLEIVGRHPEACGIELDGTMQATISRVNIRGCLHAIHLVNRNRNVLIAECHLYENRGCGVYLDDVNLHQINVTGCHISYNAGGGVVSRKGNVRNLHITGCDIESNMSPDTDATANVLIDCRGSQYGTGEVAITGCTIQHNSPSPDSANIRIIGRSDPSGEQEVVREGNITITGNVLSDVQVNVHLRDCRGVTLSGNTFWMGYAHNLLVEDCTNIVLGPNNLDRNPRYAYGTSLDARNAVLLKGCEDCTISGLHVTQVHGASAGVILENCRWMNVTDVAILDCACPALILRGCEDCRLSGLMIRDQRDPDREDVVFIDDNCKRVRVVDDGLIRGEVRDRSPR